MLGFEYKTVPAPGRAKKVKGARGPELRFAATVEETLNLYGRDGWEFVRMETFEVEERTGLAGKKSIDRRVMIFRRAVEEPVAEAPVQTFEPTPEPEAAPFAPAPPEEPPVVSSEARGPRILGRPVPPLSREADAQNGTE